MTVKKPTRRRAGNSAPQASMAKSKYGFDTTTMNPEDLRRAELKRVLNPGRGGQRPRSPITLGGANLPPAYEDDEDA